jgi:hypothetical protein
MSYLPNEPTTFINIKLTDAGRKLLSLGQLTFNKAVLSDREINYGIDRTGAYDIGCCNRILSPKDSAPTFALPQSFDGSNAVPITVGSAMRVITAQTETTGFFTGTTTGSTWAIDSDEFLGSNNIDYSTYVPDGTNNIILSGGGTGYFPVGGELVYIPWEPIQASGLTYDSSTLIDSGTPFNNLWYRVLSADTGTSIVTLDRSVPNFGGSAVTSSQIINTYFYPFNGIETYYGSAATTDTRVWNMNIIRTSSVEGTNPSISGYTTYGSIQYNGTKQYLGFGSETRQFGVIHYTNEFTGNTYAEQLVEKTVVVDIPNVMWHRYPGTAGQVTNFGIKLQDYAGSTIFDEAAQTTYRELRDGSTTSDFVVGRVYHKLKIIVITDPELLTALTYKSNRSYTLPALSLDTSSVPSNSCSTTTLDTSNTTGLLKSGYTYYVSYITYSDAPYASGATYGYPQTLPCQYIQRIEGTEDSEGNPQYLRAFFNTSFFPYLRNSVGMDAFSGTGWNANKVQLLVNEVNNINYPNNDFDNIPTDGWRLMSSGTTGNGLYTGATGSLTIDPNNLAGFQFIVSQEDYNSGSTYVLDSTFYDNNDVNTSGLTFGSESFFFGNIKAAIRATTFKSIMTVLAPDPNYNSSLNSSFDGLQDSNTYITEIGILNNSDVLVAVGKPTYPIKKNDSRYLAFQLEIDF